MEEKEKDKLVEDLLKGALKPYKLDELTQDPNIATEIRRRYIERAYSTGLEHVGSSTIDFSDAVNRNIENPIGAAQVPVGFIEILVNGDYVKGEKRPVFLATTEGKLVAGMNRGANAINKSGGANVKVLKSAMTRSTVLDAGSVANAAKVLSFLESEEGKRLIEEAFKESSKRLSGISIEAYTTGRLVYIRYGADTQAAMGMNMLTIASTSATDKVINELEKKGIKAKMVSESGNMCVDKKPAGINMIRGRGLSVVAEAIIKKEVLEEYFKVNAKAIEEINYAKNYIGSSLAGSLGHNAQVANILAATFIAYGQDVAQIVDGADAIDDVKALENGDLYIAVYLPSLEVGTYGGGTRRETAKELLMASGVYGEGDNEGKTKRALAELIASAALAGELNLLAAEAGEELAKAHSMLKR